MKTITKENTNITTTLNELYRIFHELEKNLFEKPLEEPIILIQSTKRKVLGTCSVGKLWRRKQDEKISKYEITITAEGLNNSTENIVEILLHEMVHLYCSLNDIQDTSNNFVYHNKRYKEEAENHGLEVSKAPTVGWAITKLKSETQELIKKFNINEEAFDYYKIRGISETPSKKVIYNKYICNGCKTKLSTYKTLNLICGDCNKPFELRQD